MDSNIDRSILVSMIGLNIRLDNVWKNYFMEWEYVSDIDRFLIYGSSIYFDNWSIQSLLRFLQVISSNKRLFKAKGHRTL